MDRRLPVEHAPQMRRDARLDLAGRPYLGQGPA